MTIRRPLGVVAGIAPFNFPLILGAKKVALALAAGNTFVLKPSEETSLVGLKIAEVFDKAGLPPGVLNVVTGDGPTLGEVLYSDPRVKAILFTGSTAVGRHIGVECARRGKKFDLEMGGKSPLLVMKDANLNYAVNTACFRDVHSSGPDLHGRIARDCGSAGVREIPGPVRGKGEVAEGGRSSRSAYGDRAADPRLPMPFYRSRIESSKAEGARVLCGGTYEGNYFQPTVIADVTSIDVRVSGGAIRAGGQRHQGQGCRRCDPVANNTRYGLTSAVITNDLQLAMRCALELESGSVHINGSTVHDEPHGPFSGVKDSGMGREGGQWSMDELTTLKWVTIQRGEAHYPF